MFCQLAKPTSCRPANDERLLFQGAARIAALARRSRNIMNVTLFACCRRFSFWTVAIRRDLHICVDIIGEHVGR